MYNGVIYPFLTSMIRLPLKDVGSTPVEIFALFTNTPYVLTKNAPHTL